MNICLYTPTKYLDNGDINARLRFLFKTVCSLAGGGTPGAGTVTSVGLTMPSAFTVGSSPVTTSGTIAVTGAGTTAQYIRGDGSLATYGTATSLAISGLTAATGTNSINNAGFVQQWDWPSLVTGAGLLLSSSSASALSGQVVLGISNSGANSGAGRNTYSLDIAHTRTGTTSNNYGLNVTVSGGSNNTGGQFNVASGTGINTALKLDAAGATTNLALLVNSGAVRIIPLTANTMLFLDVNKDITSDVDNTWNAVDNIQTINDGGMRFTGTQAFGTMGTGAIYKNTLYGLTFRAVSGASQDMTFFDAAGNTVLGIEAGTSKFGTTSPVRFGFGLLGSAISAYAHFAAGSTAAASAPWKANSGPLMTTAEPGAFEFLTDKPYFTITTGAARKELTLNDAALTSGTTPVATADGRLTDGLILASGTYTPSATGGTLTNVSLSPAQYMRVGNTVTVSGRFSGDFGLASSSETLEIDLPITSTFGNNYEAGGTSIDATNQQAIGSLEAMPAASTVKFKLTSSTVGVNPTCFYTFTYQIIP